MTVQCTPRSWFGLRMVTDVVVPGLYYAADSATTIEALKRPGAAEPAKAGDAIVAPKQEGAQGF